jgi:FPC/CPF motif-containing protein YcgG
MQPSPFDLATAQADNPFKSKLALLNSRYYGTKGGRAVLLSEPGQTPDLFASAAIGAFRGFVLNPDFSCVGAKSAVMHETYRLGVYDQLGGVGSTAGLCRDLFTFAREAEHAEDGEFMTFVAMFREPMTVDEREFERLLWVQLRLLNQLDAPLHEWDPSVSEDPEDPHFGFSFAETAFFIVGLHPHSSRAARRFIWPTLVFNPHAQFQHLKEEGRWKRLQEVVRMREENLQGTLNPNLADYGTTTEARQYSGRAVEPDWHPPFMPRSEQRPNVGRASACPFLASGRIEG